MKLSEFVKASKIVTGLEDPIIKIVSDGFKDVEEILGRGDYYDESYSGKPFIKGNFACVEIKIDD
jgi:hypothetical protein